MNRLIRAIALLPLLLLLVKSGMEVNQGNAISTSYWVFGLAVINLFALNMSLEKLRDGIKGILYSGLMANFLLVLTILMGQQVSLLTLFIFSVYALSVFILALLDLINVKYVDNSKAEAPFHSSDGDQVVNHSKSMEEQSSKRSLNEARD